MVPQIFYAKFSKRFKGSQQELWVSDFTHVNLLKIDIELAGIWGNTLKIWSGMWEMSSIGHLILFILSAFFPHVTHNRKTSSNYVSFSFLTVLSFLFLNRSKYSIISFSTCFLLFQWSCLCNHIIHYPLISNSCSVFTIPPSSWWNGICIFTL